MKDISELTYGLEHNNLTESDKKQILLYLKGIESLEGEVENYEPLTDSEVSFSEGLAFGLNIIKGEVE